MLKKIERFPCRSSVLEFVRNKLGANPIILSSLNLDFNGCSKDFFFRNEHFLHVSGIENCTGVLLESSINGYLIPENNRFLAKLVNHLPKNIPIYFDERHSAFGRLGSGLLWGFQAHRLNPDFIIYPEPIGNSWILSSDRISVDEDFLINACYTGNFFFARLSKSLSERSAFVKEVRGRGFLLFIELDRCDPFAVVDAMKGRFGQDWLEVEDGTLLVVKPPILSTTHADVIEFEKSLLMVLRELN